MSSGEMEAILARAQRTKALRDDALLALAGRQDVGAEIHEGEGIQSARAPAVPVAWEDAFNATRSTLSKWHLGPMSQVSLSLYCTTPSPQDVQSYRQIGCPFGPGANVRRIARLTGVDDAVAADSAPEPAPRTPAASPRT